MAGGAAAGFAGWLGALHRLAAPTPLAHRPRVGAVVGAANDPHHAAPRCGDHWMVAVGGAALRRRGRDPHPCPPGGGLAARNAAAAATDHARPPGRYVMIRIWPRCRPRLPPFRTCCTVASTRTTPQTSMRMRPAAGRLRVNRPRPAA